MDKLQRHLGIGAKGLGGARPAQHRPQLHLQAARPAGQAHRFHNYMLPIEQGGRWFLYTGLRDAQPTPSATCASPRQTAAWMPGSRSATACSTPRSALALVARPPRAAFPAGRSRDAMREAAGAVGPADLGLFAEKATRPAAASSREVRARGRTRPARRRCWCASQGLAWEAWTHREGRWRPPLQLDQRATFVNDTIAAISDSQFYGAPAWLQLDGFEERHADRAAGDTLAGHAARLSGRAAVGAGRVRVLYIRERRLFVLVKPNGRWSRCLPTAGALDVDETFRQHVEGLAAMLGAPVPASEPPRRCMVEIAAPPRHPPAGRPPPARPTPHAAAAPARRLRLAVRARAGAGRGLRARPLPAVMDVDDLILVLRAGARRDRLAVEALPGLPRPRWRCWRWRASRSTRAISRAEQTFCSVPDLQPDRDRG